ncbi:Ca-activated chloride channel family protein [Rhizobium sp. SG_E_25_P2]|uniref:VWA domain-containing protein n=1 Tax=Rhizobium sp. SG_E_25_P2 TaxID=2879942 RepID=UPI0024759CC3|nr:VWA domain-containing protein [Rhizobium sp. SG_E_25_P2]MDH6267309.1 Ca-activated chloride channel family protein [Rhizobium sp. SG_E_25_P2]
MTRDLDRLSHLAPPEASEAARAAALDAAMAAFDTQQKSATAPQAFRDDRRPSLVKTMMRMFDMPRPLFAGSAIAMLTLVPAGLYLARQAEPPAVVPAAEPNAKKVTGAPSRRESEFSASEVQGLLAQPPQTVSPAKPQALDIDSAHEAPAAAPGVAISDIAAQSLSPTGHVQRSPRPENAQVSRLRILIDPDAESDAPPLEPDSLGDRFSGKDASPIKRVAEEPVSTFSIDVDTASYAYARRMLLDGALPPPDAVRPEEMINYFPYDWPAPASPEEPFRATATVMPNPWNTGTELLHIGLRGYQFTAAQRKPANLVFLIDVSGSMDEADKLPLLKTAFRMLVDTLTPEDTVSVVTYAGASGVALEPTSARDKSKILAAIDALGASGSTAGAEGIETAYALAEKSFVKDGVNRVLLATDGDFNVGAASDDALKSLITTKRKSGVYLSVLGFGSGNYNDGLMQTLAQNGNGVAAYIDTLAEAEKALSQDAMSALFPIAEDVKIQVEFNPARVSEYRLIGYETRALNRQDFNDDKVDAGEIGSGHEVTAIYEITPKGSPATRIDDLRYGAPDAAKPASDELAYVKLRYKRLGEKQSRLSSFPVMAGSALKKIDEVSTDIRFSVAVAAFARKLRGDPELSDYGWDEIRSLAQGARGADPFGYRAEFIRLLSIAKSLGSR